jgi:hypothetical protein
MRHRLTLGAAAIVLTVGLWIFAAGRWTEEAETVEPDGHRELEISDRAVARRERGRVAESDGSSKQDKVTADDSDATVSSKLRLRLRVRAPGDDGAQLAGARVFLDDGTQVLAEGRTNSEGIFEFASRRGQVFATALAPGRPWLRQRVPEAGDAEFVLPAGAILSGRAVVSGGLPYRELALECVQVPEAAEALPLPLLRALWAVEDLVAPSKLTVGPQGEFRFEGLRPDESGTLYLGDGFGIEWADGSLQGSLSFARPVEGLRLDIIALPRITGRLVEAETGRVVPDQLVQARFEVPKHGTWSTGTRSDAEGRFTIGLANLDFSSVVLNVSRPGRRIERRIERPFRDTHDVGDFLIPAPLPWSFRTLDQEGQPLAGAMVVAGKDIAGPLTDAQGLATVDDLPRTVREVLVGAPGFRTLKVTVSRHETAAQVIVLAPANKIVIRPGDLPGDLRVGRVRLSGPHRLLPEDFNSAIHATTTERRSYSFSRLTDQIVFEVTADGAGHFSLQDLRPGVPFTVQLLGPLEQTLAVRKEPGLGEFEEREIKIDFDTNRFRLVKLDVRNARGEPLSEYSVARITGTQKDDVAHIQDEARPLALILDDRDPEASWIVEKEGYRSERVTVRALSGEQFPLTLERKRD